MNIIRKLDELYEHSAPINTITCGTVDYHIFKLNELIRFCDIKSLLRYIPVGDDSRVDSLCGYMNENPYFWIIPLTTTDPNTRFGYVLKSYHQKRYFNIFCKDNICSFYGFHKFKDFKRNYPIVLCEGTKDQNVLSGIYPFTLACLTSGLNGTDDLKAICRLTNKVILAYDNDNAGKKAIERDKDKLIKAGCKVGTLFYNTKDPGELYNNTIGQDILRLSLKNTLNSF